MADKKRPVYFFVERNLERVQTSTLPHCLSTGLMEWDTGLDASFLSLSHLLRKKNWKKNIELVPYIYNLSCGHGEMQLLHTSHYSLIWIIFKGKVEGEYRRKEKNVSDL